MGISYEYDDSAATSADKAASQIAEQGAYVGKFKKAWAITSANTGTEGITLVFEAPGQGTTEFSLYTRKADGAPVFGANFVSALMFLFGLKALRSEPGKVEQYDEEAKGRIEVDGDTFPSLCEKPIGLVFQKELYSKQGGKGDGSRLALLGVFQPETRLMVSEIKERITAPAKLDRLLKGLKVKDTRKASTEPAQPSVGGVAAGDF